MNHLEKLFTQIYEYVEIVHGKSVNKLREIKEFDRERLKNDTSYQQRVLLALIDFEIFNNEYYKMCQYMVERCKILDSQARIEIDEVERLHKLYNYKKFRRKLFDENISIVERIKPYFDYQG